MHISRFTNQSIDNFETPTELIEKKETPPITLLESINWDREIPIFRNGKWEIIPGEGVSSSETQKIVQELLSSTLSVKEKIHLFQSVDDLLQQKRDGYWEHEPTLSCTVSSTSESKEVAVPFSALISCPYFHQLHSGGYLEESRSLLSIDLPEGFAIENFEQVFGIVKPSSFKDFIAVCDLASYLGITDSYYVIDSYAYSPENLHLLSNVTASTEFLPYKLTASSMISRYFDREITDKNVIRNAIAELRQIEGFAEWAESFPLELTFHFAKLDSDDLALIGELFPSTISLKVIGDHVDYLPEQFARLEVFVAEGTRNLNDIHILEGSTYLRELRLSNTNISSLPSNCPFLREVELNSCPSIQDLSPLNASKHLQRLRLINVSIGSLPNKCPFLEEVYIQDMRNSSIDLSSLNDSTKLKHLCLSSISTPVHLPSGCKQLEYLDLDSCVIASLSPLNDSPALRLLFLNEVEGAQYLPVDCPLLEEVRVIRCPQITDLLALGHSNYLRELVLSNLPSIISLPANCKALKHINIENCPGIVDFSSLDGSTAIETISLYPHVRGVRLPRDCPYLQMDYSP